MNPEENRAGAVRAAEVPPKGWKPKLLGYDGCRCVLTQYCDGMCRPIWERYIPPSDEPLRIAGDGGAEQALSLYFEQAEAIRNIWDEHAPFTHGNLQTRVAQLALCVTPSAHGGEIIERDGFGPKTPLRWPAMDVPAANWKAEGSVWVDGNGVPRPGVLPDEPPNLEPTSKNLEATVFDQLMAFEKAAEVMPTFADAVYIALAAKKRATGIAGDAGSLAQRALKAMEAAQFDAEWYAVKEELRAVAGRMGEATPVVRTGEHNGGDYDMTRSAGVAVGAAPDPLRQAAEQFLASCKDGNVAELIDYYADIFTEALAEDAGRMGEAGEGVTFTLDQIATAVDRAGVPAEAADRLAELLGLMHKQRAAGVPVVDGGRNA